MRKVSLGIKGLSLSQAQSISNLCNQRAQDIANTIATFNNAEKTLFYNEKKYVEKQGNPIPSNIVDLIKEKGKLHAVQAFLMENIKAKDAMLKELKTKQYITGNEYPAYPTLDKYTNIPLVTEAWGWEQLSLADYNEYLEVEAMAAHIGQFIHKDSKLDTLRKELTTIKTLEWITIKDGEKTPLDVNIHHTPEQLLEFHNELATLHRNYEQRVNYFKATVKNKVTDENARIAKVNADGLGLINNTNNVLLNAYKVAVATYETTEREATEVFEEKRQKDTFKNSQLRIVVDPRFKETIDSYLEQIAE